MKRRWLSLVCVVAVVVPAVTAPAADLHLEFVRGLRERGYYDYAQLYLNQIEQDAQVPAEVKRLVPYERAVTLLEESRTDRNPDSRRALLEQAQGMFEQFAAANPDDPRTPEANHERANIFLERAKVAIIEARSPANAGPKATQLRQQARADVEKARAVYQKAHDQYEAAWKKFPVYIDEKDTQQREAREEAEKHYIRAQLDLALCSYWEAQTYPADALEFKKLLSEAAEQFDAIHQKYRSQAGGLYARMWQGKCFEEMNDFGKALGIYNELLGHPGESPVMRQLQDQVLQFKLIVLNKDVKSDHRLVVNFATEWLEDRENRVRSRTPIGVGILYERAVAREKLADALPPADEQRTALYKQAMADALQIAGYPYEYRDAAIFMQQRLNQKLGTESGDPETFQDALVLATTIRGDIQKLDAKIAQAKTPDETQQLLRERMAKIREAARILQLALRLADADTELSRLNAARLLLSLMYYQAGRNYESAVVGEFVGRRFQQEDPHTARDAAFLALAAFNQEYTSKEAAAKKGSDDDRQFDVEGMVRLATLITESWPDSDKATDARMLLGQIYDMRNEPLEAARYYMAIPATSEGYATAQLRAGQMFWNAYLSAAGLPDDQKPTPAQLQEWETKAEQHLKAGIEKKAVPKDLPAPPELVAAKVTLAQIQLNAKQFDETLALLTKDPHPVMQAIALKDGEKPPATGIKSIPFQTLCYRLLLWSQIGKEQTDAALKTLDELEKVVPADDTQTLTDIYEGLGRELEKELTRLMESGETERFDQLLSAFDRFLSALYERKDTLTYGQMRWVAESFYGLGGSLEEGKNPRAGEYFQKAADTYRTMIQRAVADPDHFAPGVPLSGFRLRLADSLMRQQSYAEAVQVIEDVLAEKPKAIDAQFQAAEILQTWGASGGTDAPKRLNEAINGRAVGQSKRGIWGYAQLASLLSRQLEAGREQYRDQYYDAVYRKVDTRRQLGAQSGGDEQTAALTAARMELQAFAAITSPEKISDEQWQKFDTLYQDIQRDMGTLDPVALTRPEGVMTSAAANAAAGTLDTNVTPTDAAAKPAQAAAPAAEESGGVLGMVFGVAVLLAMLGGAGYMVVAAQKKPNRRALTSRSTPAGNPFAASAPDNGRTTAASARRTVKPAAAKSAAPQQAAAKPAQPTAAKPAARPQAKPKPAGEPAADQTAPAKPAKPAAKPRPRE